MPSLNCHSAVKENSRRWKYVQCCNKKEQVCCDGECGLWKLKVVEVDLRETNVTCVLNIYVLYWGVMKPLYEEWKIFVRNWGTLKENNFEKSYIYKLWIWRSDDCASWYILVIKPTRHTKFLKFIFGIKLYMFRTVPLSIIRSLALYIHEWYISYRFADIYHCCVYSAKHLMMDGGTVRNM